ncbi:MAG: hypothetical protein IT317_11945 [Anaerolineales bacterium]|nr:hypothetical protein [Anaerolineales bacterium]
MAALWLKRNSRGAAAVVLAAAWALPVAAYAELGRYTRYMADDYCMGYLAQAAGFFGAQRYWYMEWSGRYTYTFLVGLAELFPGGLIPWLPGLVLAGWYAALTWAATGLLRAAERPRRLAPAALLAGLTLTSALLALPNLTQSLYWRGGVLTYIAPLALGALLVGELVHLPAGGRRRGPGLGLIALTAFASSGFAEVYTVVQGGALGLAILAVGMAARHGERGRRAWPLLLAALTTLTGLLIVILAPGTRTRAADYATPPGLGAVLHNSMVYTGWFLRDALTTRWFGWLLPLTLAAGAGALLAEAPAPRLRRPAVLTLLCLPPAVLAVLVAAYAAAFYAIQYLPPERVLVIHWAVVAAGSAAWGWLAGQTFASRLLTRSRAVRSGALAALVVGGSLLALEVVAGIQALRPERRLFAVNWQNFDAWMRAQPGTGPLTVTRLDNPAGIDSFSADPAFWTNRCAGLYYGHELRAAAPVPTATSAELAAAAPVQGQLGGVARVVAVGLSPTAVRPGETVTVTVYWEPLAVTAQPLTVFVHLLGAAGSLAQADAYPGAGQYPTTRWLLGRPFADAFQLVLPPDVPAGEAQVIVGLYDLATLQRQPASGPAANADGEAWLELGQITIAR